MPLLCLEPLTRSFSSAPAPNFYPTSLGNCGCYICQTFPSRNSLCGLAKSFGEFLKNFSGLCAVLPPKVKSFSNFSKETLPLKTLLVETFGWERHTHSTALHRFTGGPTQRRDHGENSSLPSLGLQRTDDGISTEPVEHGYTVHSGRAAVCVRTHTVLPRGSAKGLADFVRSCYNRAPVLVNEFLLQEKPCCTY